VTVTEPSLPVHRRPRVNSIDLLRGLVMVIMLLDHTRDFVHADAWRFDPTDLAHTTPVLFFTRWITHFCAPVFVLLAGTGARLQLAAGKPKGELARFLLSRGVWLIVLEFTVVRLGICFNFDYRLLGIMQVIWAIGASMLVLAALIWLPVRAIAAIGIGMIGLHNLLDHVQIKPWFGPPDPPPSLGATLWLLLHQPSIILPFGPRGPHAFLAYPLVPWIGVMATGYVLGGLYLLEPVRRRALLLRLGMLITLGFVALRLTNYYGDPTPWSAQPTFGFTLLSVLNTQKYPPSLLYLMMTLGPALLFLAWIEQGATGRIGQALVIIGRVPLFYYLLQWFTAHGIALGLSVLAGKPTALLFSSPPFTNVPENSGFDLWVVYACWVAGVLLLYPFCQWYAGVKARRRDWWLSYL
jgi:uncharacterized membrane protein